MRLHKFDDALRDGCVRLAGAQEVSNGGRHHSQTAHLDFAAIEYAVGTIFDEVAASPFQEW
jgi:hypothetical protein